MAQLFDIANAITARYQADGYVLSRATVRSPVRGGVVNIDVTEGYVSDVRIDGEHAESGPSKLIEGYGKKVMADKPLRAETLERYLLLANDLPGVTAKGVLRPVGAGGATQLVFVLGHDKWEASYTIDNRGTDLLGPIQHSVTMGANSFLGMYDRTLLRLVTTSPTSELRFFDAQHEQQIGSEGTRLFAIYSRTASEPHGVLAPLDVDGDAESIALRLDHPFIRSRTENLRGRVEIGARNSTTEILGTNFSEDRIRAVRVGANYDFADRLRGVNLIGVEVSRGIDAFNATDAGAGRSRADGEADFTKFNLELARLQNLPSGFSLLVQGTGQYSLDPLLSGEEFTLGGANFGRAYDSSELVGDHGLAGKVELRWGKAVGQKYFDAYQLFTYYDVGSVWEKDAAAGVDDRRSLAALGGGIRANFTEQLSGELELGVPMTRNVALEGDDDKRIFFSLVGRL